MTETNGANTESSGKGNVTLADCNTKNEFFSNKLFELHYKIQYSHLLNNTNMRFLVWCYYRQDGIVV